MAKQTTPSPAYPWDETLVTGVQTFMGVPYSRDLSKSKAAILGIPFDCGLHPVRHAVSCDGISALAIPGPGY